jgi:hypothetical protein
MSSEAASHASQITNEEAPCGLDGWEELPMKHCSKCSTPIRWMDGFEPSNKFELCVDCDKSKQQQQGNKLHKNKKSTKCRPIEE